MQRESSSVTGAHVTKMSTWASPSLVGSELGGHQAPRHVPGMAGVGWAQGLFPTLWSCSQLGREATWLLAVWLGWEGSGCRGNSQVATVAPGGCLAEEALGSRLLLRQRIQGATPPSRPPLSRQSDLCPEANLQARWHGRGPMRTCLGDSRLPGPSSPTSSHSYTVRAGSNESALPSLAGELRPDCAI